VLERASEPNTLFETNRGSPHIFCTKNVSPAFEEAGGKHMAMIRNPLNRIRSHMEQKLRQTLIANGLKLSFQPSVAEKEKSKSIFYQHQSKLKEIAKAAVEVTLYTDLDNINSCPRDDLLKFEGLFEANETNDLIRNIQKIISCDSLAILQVLKNAKKINQHVQKNISLISLLPTDFSELMVNCAEQVEQKVTNLNENNIHMSDIYKSFGYDFQPTDLVKLF
jgi:hypothetical protein